MRNVVGIVSGKGGVGKTTLTVNLGLAMHKLGEDVIVVDADLKNPTIAVHLGTFEFDTTIQDVLEKDMPLLEALYIHPTGLKYIPAHLSLRYLNVDSTKLRKAFADLPSMALVDSPPGLGKEALAVMEVSDQVIVVTTPDLPAITSALRAIDTARAMGVRVAGIVVNCVRRKKYEITPIELEAVSGAKVLQVIPWDENVQKSIAYKIPLVEYTPYSPASVAIFELASRLTGADYKKPSLVKLRNLMKSLGDILNV